MLNTTMSPTPFFVINTGSLVEQQNSLISLELLRKSDIGLIAGIICTALLNIFISLLYQDFESVVNENLTRLAVYMPAVTVLGKEAPPGYLTQVFIKMQRSDDDA